MKMKRIAAMLLAGAMLTGLCACGGSGGDDKKAAGSGGGSADGAKISMSLKTTSAEYWQYVQAGAEAAAKDLGVTVDVKLSLIHISARTAICCLFLRLSRCAIGFDLDALPQ